MCGQTDDGDGDSMNYWYLKFDEGSVNECNFKSISKLLSSSPSFFRGIDLTNNPLFKEQSLKSLFHLHKSPASLSRITHKLNTRYLTFVSLEKTGIKNELMLSCLWVNIFSTCPDLEILILNSLPITDKWVANMAEAVKKAVGQQNPHQLVTNLKEVGLSNTKVTDKGIHKLLLVFMKHTFLEVINLEWNLKIGFRTASFILQQLCSAGDSQKISLREVFLEYTKVSDSLRTSLEIALHSYHTGNLSAVNRISRRYSNGGSHRSQPRQNSSRYAFANDFSILDERDSEETDIGNTSIMVKDISKSTEKIQMLNTSTYSSQSQNKNFLLNNHLYQNKSLNAQPDSTKSNDFKKAFEQKRNSRKWIVPWDKDK